MDKTLPRATIIEVINSLEKTCEEYSIIIPIITDLTNAKVAMASMRDRIQQEVQRLKKAILID